MLPSTLFLVAFLLGAFCSGIIWMMNGNPFLAKIFFVVFPITMGIFAIVYILRNDFLYSNFFLGVLASIIVLVPFRALPYIEGWTRTGSFLQRFLGFPLHHSLLGFVIILMMIVVVLNTWNNKVLLDAEIVSFGLGWGIFWLSSQIPEIIRNRTFFF